MNNQRRKDIRKAADLLYKLQIALDEVKDILDTARNEEQEYMDNMPESLQSGEKYSNAENAVDVLEDVISNIEDIQSNIETQMENIESII